MAPVKNLKTLDKKSMKRTKGGIIAVLKPATFNPQPDPPGGTADDVICRKQGKDQDPY